MFAGLLQANRAGSGAGGGGAGDGSGVVYKVIGESDTEGGDKTLLKLALETEIAAY